MKAYWSDTRANGQPLERGTVCRVIDLEDGTNPIFVYGGSEEEVYGKIERQNMNAQLALARRAPGSNATHSAATQPGAGAAGPAAAPRRAISADQVMQATADLTNPAKSGQAVATLLEHATGMDPIEQGRQAYTRTATAWEDATPAFYPCPANRQLVGDRAIALAGQKPGMVTHEILDLAFRQREAAGVLVERPDEPAETIHSEPTLTTFPGESLVQRSERPRGTLYATGARSTRFSAPQHTTQTRALKYTEEQIRTMPERQRREVFDTPEYIRACEFYFSEARA